MSESQKYIPVPRSATADRRDPRDDEGGRKAANRARRNAAGKLREAEHLLKGSPGETFPLNSPHRDEEEATGLAAPSGDSTSYAETPDRRAAGGAGLGSGGRNAAKRDTVAGPRCAGAPPDPMVHLDPGRGNTGVDTAKVGPFTGFSFNGIARLGRASDYFHRLALDTLAVSVHGGWEKPEAAERFYNLRSLAEAAALVNEGFFLDAPDGTQLQVFPHAGRGGYRVLLRGADSPEIKGSPNKSRPPILIRFGARWCVENSVADLERWILDFLAMIHFKPGRLALSEAHVRCDVPYAFDHEDLKLMRGWALKNAGHTIRVNNERPTGITNLGGKKDLVYSLYDKRLQQSNGNDPYWQGLWESYSIPSQSPIWRIESRFKGEKLRRAGLHELSDLTPEAVAELWHWFATKHFVMVADRTKRLGRAGFSEKWKPIVECGTHFRPAAPQFNVEVDQSKLAKQAIGTLAKSFLMADVTDFCVRARRVVEDVLIRSRIRGCEILASDDRLLRHHIEQTISDCWEETTDLERSKLVDWMVGEIQEKMRKHPARKPFSTRPATRGES